MFLFLQLLLGFALIWTHVITFGEGRVSFQLPQERISLKIMLYNVWNFDNGPNWNERKLLISRLVLDYDPHIVGWNELRNDMRSNKIRSQVRDLLDLLPQFPFYKFQAALPDTASHSEEGIGVFSKYPFLNDYVSYRKLTITGTQDSNQRICLYTPIVIPKLGLLDLFLTHWSFEISQQEQNAVESLEFINRNQKSSTQIFFGDMNIYPHNERAANFLLGKETIDNRTGNFVDVWLEIHQNDKGWTFSTLPEKPTSRPDRIYIRGTDCSIENVERIGNFTGVNGQVPSDHLAVFLELSCLPFKSKISLTGEQPKQEKTTQERTKKEQTTSEQTTSEQTTFEQTTKEQTTFEQTTKEQTTFEQTTKEQTTFEQTTKEQTTFEQTTAEKTTSEQTTQKTIVKQTTKEQTTETMEQNYIDNSKSSYKLTFEGITLFLGFFVIGLLVIQYFRER